MIIDEFQVKFKTTSQDLGIYKLMTLLENEIIKNYAKAFEIFSINLIERFHDGEKNIVLIKADLTTDNPQKYGITKQFLRMMVLKMKRKYDFEFDLKGIKFSINGELSKDIKPNKFIEVLKA